MLWNRLWVEGKRGMGTSRSDRWRRSHFQPSLPERFEDRVLLTGLDASILATSNLTSYQVGEEITTTLVVTNASTDTSITSAANTQVSDNLPYGINTISVVGPYWSISGTSGKGPSVLTANYIGPSVAPGAAFPTITVTGIFDVNAEPTWTDTASVVAQGDVNSANNVSSFTVDVNSLLPATSLVVRPTIDTYGGTTILLAQLTSNGTAVSNELVDFQLGGIDLGTSDTNFYGNAVLSDVSLAGIGVGTYAGDVTASFAGNRSYTASNGSADLSVTPAPLTVAVNNASKVYGQVNPEFTGTLNGVLNGDDVTALYSTTATASSDVLNGGYPITVVGLSGSDASDYSITNSTTGALTVTPSPLTISANNLSKVYGQANPSFSASYNGFVLGQGPSALNGTLGFSASVTAASHVGSDPITPSGLASSNYAISYASGTLQITPAPLTIFAVSQTEPFGQLAAPLTVDYQGFVNGDSTASLRSIPALTTSATPYGAIGIYPITIGLTTSADYTIRYVNGAINLTPDPTMQGYAGLVTTLYHELLNRAPDLDGLAYYTQKLAGGASVTGILNGFVASPEYAVLQATHHGTGISPATALSDGQKDERLIVISSTPIASTAQGYSALVTTLYRELLGRAPEAGVLPYWVQELTDGVPATTLLTKLVESVEYNTLQLLNAGTRIGAATSLSDALTAENSANSG